MFSKFYSVVFGVFRSFPSVQISMPPNAAGGCHRYILLMPGFLLMVRVNNFSDAICTSFMAFFGLFLEIPGNSCKFIEFIGVSWKCLEHTGTFRGSWSFLDFSGIFWSFAGLLVGPIVFLEYFLGVSKS